MIFRRLFRRVHGAEDGEPGAAAMKSESSTKHLERRMSPRLPMQLRAEFHADGDDTHAGRIGTTSNVSSGGMYFDTSEWLGLKVGDDIEMRLSGLSPYDAGPLMRTLSGRAKILRLDLPDREAHPSAKAGVAAAFCGSPCFDIYRWRK